MDSTSSSVLIYCDALTKYTTINLIDDQSISCTLNNQYDMDSIYSPVEYVSYVDIYTMRRNRRCPLPKGAYMINPSRSLIDAGYNIVYSNIEHNSNPELSHISIILRKHYSQVEALPLPFHNAFHVSFIGVRDPISIRCNSKCIDLLNTRVQSSFPTIAVNAGAKPANDVVHSSNIIDARNNNTNNTFGTNVISIL